MFLGRLHVLTDVELQQRFDHRQLAELAMRGGADIVQVRDKRPLSDEVWLRQASAVVTMCRAHAALCLINDRVDIALLSEAGGVHLGAQDLAPHEARLRLGPEKCIGRTANSLAEARAFFDAPIDYLGVGPVFGTRSKANAAPPLGIEVLRAIAAASPHPVIAIGGIRPQHVAALRAAGAHGIAVLSGIVCAADPRAATLEYAQALSGCR